MILVVAHHWYHDVIGGAFRLATEFAEFLATQGHRVTYVCCGPQGQVEAEQRVVERGVSVIRYAPPRGLGRWSRTRWHADRTEAIAHGLIRQEPMVALSGHSPLQFQGAVRSLRGHDVFKTYTVHSPFDDELLSQSGVSRPPCSSRIAAWLARRIERTNIRWADQVQPLSTYTLSLLGRKHRQDLGAKGVVAPGWVDCARFDAGEDRAALRQRLGSDWQTDEKTFFSLRRLEPRMGMETLVRAAAVLREIGAPCRVLVGGSGSQAGPLRNLVRELELESQVRFLGQVPEDQLPLCYAAADCFVLPTRALECFGLIVLEAYAAGTPVIASDVAAIPELVSQAGNDWLFPPGDHTALAARMQEYLRGNLRPSASLRGIATAYDQAKILPVWERLLWGRPTAGS